MPPDVNLDDAVLRVMRLMAIPGKSCEEQLVVDHLRSELATAGIPESAVTIDDVHRRSPAGGNVGNLILSLPGTKRGQRRLLMAHLDTVPLCVGSKPVRKGGFIRSADPKTALGGDNRSGAAVLLTAVLEIVRQKLPHPPLTFFWPVQEEIGLLGARHVSLSKLGQPKLCFNWDGGGASNVCLGATGAFHIDVEVQGIASHAGVHPEAGVSAIAIAALAMADLHANGWHGLVVKGRNRGTSNIGIVRAGDATNVVTPHLSLQAEVRSHDGKFRQRLADAFQKAFQRAARAIRNDRGDRGRVQFSSALKYESFCLEATEPSAKAAMDAIREIGLEPQTRISNGGLDANWLSARGLPTVTLGAGQADVHTVNESLNVEEFLNGCRIALRLATG